MQRVLLTCILGGLLILSAGCDWVTKDLPETARVRLEGNDGTTVRLITSTVFLAGRTLEGDLSVNLLAADTSTVTLPFEATYDIRTDQRFVARVYRPNLDSDELQMRAWIDGERRYNKAGRPVPEDSLLQFVYVFRSNNLPDDNNNL